jgi:hypothetical protein
MRRKVGGDGAEGSARASAEENSKVIKKAAAWARKRSKGYQMRGALDRRGGDGVARFGRESYCCQSFGLASVQLVDMNLQSTTWIL